MSSFDEHPFRAAIMDEVHARPVDIIPPQCRIRRLVFVMSSKAGSTARALDRFATFCAAAGHARPDPARRQFSFDLNERHVTWEFHTEFVTITWRGNLDDAASEPDDIGLEAIGDSLLIASARVDVIEDAKIPERLLSGFNLASLCVVNVDDGGGQVATDFVADESRVTRYELAAGSLTTLRRSILAKRLLEIDTYRNMALLGLPLARDAAPQLRSIELELTNVVEGLSMATTPELVQRSLHDLHDLSVRSGQLSERLGYRFAAGRAYGEVLRARLAGLRESRTNLGSTLSGYVGNRVDPALATCAALETRLAVLADKLERAIGILNVRIGVDMQLQNAALLNTIAQTGRSQFLLQRTVEGLSTIAISYYLLGILTYALGGPLERLHWDKALILSLSAPLVLFAVWLMFRGVRRTHAPM